MEKKMKQIPKPTRKRLIALVQILSHLLEEKIEYITSEQLADISSWSKSTVRRDISLLELYFGTSQGYSVADLKKAIEEKLNLKVTESTEIKKCCIVGLEKIGKVFLDESIFAGTKFKIVAGFDSNQNRIEILKTDFPLYSTSEMESIIRAEKIQFALLCVPDESALKYAEKLSDCGIKGIINYSRIPIVLKTDAKIENASPAVMLENLI